MYTYTHSYIYIHIHTYICLGQYVFDVSADSDIVVNHDDKNDVTDRSVEHSLAVFENGTVS